MLKIPDTEPDESAVNEPRDTGSECSVTATDDAGFHPVELTVNEPPDPTVAGWTLAPVPLGVEVVVDAPVEVVVLGDVVVVVELVVVGVVVVVELVVDEVVDEVVEEVVDDVLEEVVDEVVDEVVLLVVEPPVNVSFWTKNASVPVASLVSPTSTTR
jgi:hypothetical protein